MNDIVNPNWLSVRLHEFFWFVLSQKTYKEYVDWMQLGGDEKFLDFGCGPGAASIHIAPLLQKCGGELTCFDLSHTWIQRARKRLRRFDNVRFFSGDIRQSSLENNYFNAVNIHFMLHDIPVSQRLDILQALAVKMTVGAKLYIREPISSDHGIPIDEIKQMLETAGFQAEKTTIQTIFGKQALTALFIKL